MTLKMLLLVLAGYFFSIVLAPLSALAAHPESIIDQIDHAATLGEKAESSLLENIADEIEKDPNGVSILLSSKLKRDKLTEKQLPVYIWALGFTKDVNAVDTVIEIYRGAKPGLVQNNCLRTLAQLGGKKAADCVLSALATTSDKETRFEIFNLLGQMKCEAVLPMADEILKQNPNEYYWQSIFVFGKMGDKSIPFLIKKIHDKDYNVRANAINVLGQWLIAPEAAQPLQKYYWIEKDQKLRGTMLSSLEKTISDFSIMQKTFEQIVAKEKDKELLTFAQETITNLNRVKTEVTSFAQKKKLSPEVFNREWKQVYQSAGHKGDYELLAISSSIENESKLKELRERILQRNSDEAFSDYQKINDIIIKNRLAANMAQPKVSQK